MINEKNISPDGEVLGSDDARLSSLLHGLKRVAAPADFDVRVRARIAKGRPQATGSFFSPFLVKLAAGSSVAILALGVLGYVWLGRADSSAGQPVAGVQHNRPEAIPTTSANISSLTPAPEPSEEHAVSNPPAQSGASRPLLRDTASERSPGESANNVGRSIPTDQALSGDKKVYPKGVNPNAPKLPKPKEFDNGPRTPAAEVLSILGIGAKYDRGAWRVDSVNAETAAERAGLKKGDVIQALNDQAIKQNTSFSGSFSVKDLRVKRDGQTIKISLSNK